MGRLPLQQRVIRLPTHGNPATARLQLFHHGQQLGSRFRFEDGAGDVDHIRIKNLYQREVFHPELDLTLQAQMSAHLFGKANVGGQQFHPDGPGPKGQRRGKNHLAATTTQVQKRLPGPQAGLVKYLQSRKVGSLSKAKIPKGPLGQGPPLQPDIEGHKTWKVVDPHQDLYLPQVGNPD